MAVDWRTKFLGAGKKRGEGGGINQGVSIKGRWRLGPTIGEVSVGAPKQNLGGCAGGSEGILYLRAATGLAVAGSSDIDKPLFFVIQ